MNQVSPSIYNDSPLIGEYAGEQLQSCCFRAIVELVGLFELHLICQSMGVANRKAATFAIEKFNKQNHTRLTYECVRDLTPTYSFAPIGDPIIFSSDLFELKKRACQLILASQIKGFDSVDFNETNHIMQSMDLTEIDIVVVYYPEPITDSDSGGFWVVYKSHYLTKRPIIEDSIFCMSEYSPIGGLPLSGGYNNSYGLPPHEEASIKQSSLQSYNFRRYKNANL